MGFFHLTNLDRQQLFSTHALDYMKWFNFLKMETERKASSAAMRLEQKLVYKLLHIYYIQQPLEKFRRSLPRLSQLKRVAGCLVKLKLPLSKSEQSDDRCMRMRRRRRRSKRSYLQHSSISPRNHIFITTALCHEVINDTW